MIYHVTTKDDWEKARQFGSYECASLQSEGFIHTSSKDQLAGVLQRYYTGRTDLVLLHIDEQKLQSPLKYELAPSVNEMFPHIYGPINVTAVIETEEL